MASPWSSADTRESERRRSTQSSMGTATAKQKHAGGGYSFAQQMPLIVPAAPRTEFERTFPSLNEPARRARPQYKLSDLPFGVSPAPSDPANMSSSSTLSSSTPSSSTSRKADRSHPNSSSSSAASTTKQLQSASSNSAGFFSSTTCAAAEGGAGGVPGGASREKGAHSESHLNHPSAREIDTAHSKAPEVRAADIVAGAVAGGRSREEEEELERQRVREKMELEQRKILGKLVPSSASGGVGPHSSTPSTSSLSSHARIRASGNPSNAARARSTHFSSDHVVGAPASKERSGASGGGKEVLKATGRIKVRPQRAPGVVVAAAGNRATAVKQEDEGRNDDGSTENDKEQHTDHHQQQQQRFSALDEYAHAHDDLNGSGGGILPRLPKPGEPRFDELVDIFIGSSLQDDESELH
uniref:Uncharacterized protein n=1 Tax=Erythrolobus madagascarensis TaxID=708628 RepID=A0A7S0T534_9RHOD|mmetsp:Transcript_3132/g.6782  ORF Transcript_3132/g.6782 Transcript_3132/m.6782 type:complete len:413 (+) Transcript_3132:354-1592(+)